MAAEKNIPEIRFKGFEGEWEVYEIKELADRYDNLRVPITASDRISGNTPYYGANGIQDYVEGFTHDGEYILVAEDGANDLKNYPVQYVNGKIWVNNHTHVLQGKAYVIDNKYLKYAISQTNIEPFLVGGGRAKLNAETMMKIEIVVSTHFNEQTQIGTYFQHLDSLITLHQRKYDKLLTVKKAMLEKMFPKDGADVPEIRFKGFEGKWDRHSLIEVARYRNGRAHENDISEKGEYIVVNSKFISTNGDVKKFSNKQIEPLYKSEIGFVLSDVPNGRAIARTFLVQEDNKYTLNQRIAGITPLEYTDSYFLYILMNRHKYFLQFDDGAKQTNLSKSDVEDFTEFYPEKSEQTQIGTFFQNLDTLITQHQKQLEKLKYIKKACLEKMFV